MLQLTTPINGATTRLLTGRGPILEVYIVTYVPRSINSHYFHIIGDGHQPNSRGLYTHYKDSVIKGGMTIPNIATFDHGTYEDYISELQLPHTFTICLQFHGSSKQWLEMNTTETNKKTISQKWFDTLPKTNIAPEHGPSQEETSLPIIHFQVQTVSFREGNIHPQKPTWKPKMRRTWRFWKIVFCSSGRCWFVGASFKIPGKNQKLGGGNSNIFWNFHPDPWGNDPIWLIFFRWVETTN